MLVLVTGAAGRIGAHLTHLLLEAGHQVRAFVLPNDPRADLIRAPGVQQVHGRLEDDVALSAATSGVDAIYHLGGALTSRGNSDQECFDLNLRTTFVLLMAPRAAGPRIRRFVYASSDAVYVPGPGAPPADLPVGETQPRLAASVYGASRVAAPRRRGPAQREADGGYVEALHIAQAAHAAELVDAPFTNLAAVYQPRLREAVRAVDGG